MRQHDQSHNTITAACMTDPWIEWKCTFYICSYTNFPSI